MNSNKFIHLNRVVFNKDTESSLLVVNVGYISAYYYYNRQAHIMIFNEVFQVEETLEEISDKINQQYQQYKPAL